MTRTETNALIIAQMASIACKKCSSPMQHGKALAQTFVGGMPDFEGDTHSSTFSAGGPGKMIDCLKCTECGWSMTSPMDPPTYGGMPALSTQLCRPER